MSKRILLIFLFLILFIFLINTSVYATEETYELNEIVTAEYPYYVIIKRPSDENYYLFSCKGTYTMHGSGLTLHVDSNGVRIFSNVNNVWISCTEVPNSSSYSNGDIKFYSSFDSSVVKYSNYDIYDTNDLDYLFFQRTPLLQENLMEMGVVATATTEVKLEETLLQIVKILPLILVVVVSFLGLRKAWQILSTLLHQA